MAKTFSDSGINTADQGSKSLTFQAEGQERIELPSSEFMADASMNRDGDNLILTTPAGEVAVIEGYFSADPAPLLASPDGVSVLTPSLIESFSRSPAEFAATNTSSDESPVGAVEEVQGHATVTRADGTVETITIGTPIYQGDIVETDASGAVNISFIDETSMAVSENARLAIDQYTFDPATESGTTNFSVLRGLFVFTSGLIGRDDPDDVKIDTPVGSIGIRGTIIAGEINPSGESKISVIEGAIVITNGAMETTLSQQFETVRLHGFDQPMESMGVVAANDISSRFSSIGTVSPTLFSSIQDAGTENSAEPAQAQPSQSEPVQTQPEPQQPAQQDPVSEPQSFNQPAQQPVPVAAATVAEPVLPAADFDSGIANLHGPSTGLPTDATLAGQTSALDTGSAGSVSVTSPGPVLAPVATTTTTSAMPVNTSTPVVDRTPPPDVIADRAGNNAPTLGLRYVSGGLTDLATSGAVIGHITTGQAGFTYTQTNTTSHYTLASNGNGVDIVLTSVGRTYLGSSLDLLQLDTLNITATHADGRTLTNSFTPTITDANAASTLRLDGPAPGISILTDNISNKLGYSITALGDIDGDGFDDFGVTNDTTTPTQNHIYKFFGDSSELPSGNITGLGPSLFMTAPNQTSPSNYSNTVISGIGDFNGDGVNDYVIGQSNNNLGPTAGAGTASIVSGANPTMQWTLSGPTTSGNQIGFDVAGIGDFNNDGYNDVVIGAPGLSAGNGGFYYASGSASPTNISTTNINSGTTDSQTGSSVTGIGDFNGDGYVDFAIGSPGAGATNQGAVKLYFGSQTGTLSTTALLTSNISAEGFGTEVTGLGDINGDGRSDLMVGGSGNAGYIYLGDSTASYASRASSFSIPASLSVTGAGGIGDFNADGYDDFAISLADADDTKIFVVYGKNNFNGTINLDYLKNPENALQLNYNRADNTSDIEIKGIGDIDGDGYDDFAMGVPDANGAMTGDGGIIVAYGRSNSGTGIVGDAANNILEDGGVAGKILRGGAGNDIIKISNANFLGIDGGSNTVTGGDILEVRNNLDFRGLDFEKISGIETIQFASTGQTLTLSLENLFNLLKTSDTGSLHINGVTGNILAIDSSTTVGGIPTNAQIGTALSEMTDATVNAVDLGNHTRFNIGGYELYIDNHVSVALQ